MELENSLPHFVDGCLAQRTHPSTLSPNAGHATMTIPSGTKAGAVLYQDIAYGTKTTLGLNAGEELSLEVVTQASDSGTAAGVGFITFEFAAVTDSSLNQTNMTAQNT